MSSGSELCSARR